MVKRIVETYVDDLDNNLSADETVSFALDGVERVIDLNEENAEQLRRALAPFVAASRRVGGRKTRNATTTSSPADTRKAREWAKAQGIKVSDRGRIPQSVVEQYLSATGGV